MGRGAGKRFYRAPLSPAERRVQSGHGFYRRCGYRKIWLCARNEGDMAADARRLGSRRRIRARTKAESSISWNPEFLTPHLLFRDEGSGPHPVVADKFPDDTRR